MNLEKTFTLKLWLSIQSIILVVASYYIFSSNHENVETLFVAIESILIFPVGLLTLYLNDIFNAHHYFISHESFFIFVFINWIFYTVVGYIQWFIILPKMINKCKEEGCLQGHGF